MMIPQNLLPKMKDGAVMSRKLLITMSEDAGVLYGVRFIIHFFNPAPNLRLELVFMPPAAEAEAPRDHLVLDQALHLAEKMFTDQGFEVFSPNVEGGLAQCQSLDELARLVEHGNYDAVVLGRRGAARLEEYLSVRFQETVFDENLDFPFWVCRAPDLTRENVLLCVDGSKQGLCAADHVGFMCRDESRHSICVTYLADPARRDRLDEDRIIDNALRMLKVNDVPEDRIAIKILAEQDHVKGILREAEQGRYAVVAVSRAGIGRGMMSQRQFGSVSLRLARTLTGASLWVCGYPCKI